MKKEDNFETKNKEMIKKTHEYLKALPEIKEILNKIRYKKNSNLHQKEVTMEYNFSTNQPKIGCVRKNI